MWWNKNFDNDNANTNNSKCFIHKAKLLGNTVTQPNPNRANGILENATIAVPWKYLSNNLKFHWLIAK